MVALPSWAARWGLQGSYWVVKQQWRELLASWLVASTPWECRATFALLRKAHEGVMLLAREQLCLAIRPAVTVGQP